MQVNVGVMESIDTITGKRTRLQKAGRDDDKTTKGDDVVNNKVISIIHDDIEEMDKVNRLRAIRTVLTEADARYIRKEATKAGWKLLIKSANQILSSLTG
jgi:hypothetical protein